MKTTEKDNIIASIIFTLMISIGIVCITYGLSYNIWITIGSFLVSFPSTFITLIKLQS